MSEHPVILVGFEDQPNLGLGYLASVLEEDGFQVELLDWRLSKPSILQYVTAVDPLIIGLSIIYQYYTPQATDLVGFLRRNGVACFLCVGGHYPSLRPRDVVESMLGLDCVVRFEGEHTLRDIARRLRGGEDWRDLQSIAYLSDGEYTETSLRPLIDDLDTLPFPRKRVPPDRILGVPFTTILASRGCPRGCTFCSIRQFYSAPPGRIRRVRSPENVVDEMQEIYDQHGVRVFLFQDDDFALSGKADREWVRRFAQCLRQRGLDQSFLWKMSCRADEVDRDVFAELKDVGMFLAYLGIESGNSTGLRTLNKNITVEQNRQAVETLKQLNLRYQFGFMLFDPSSTFDLVLENIRFLREICGDGYALASFCKTLPYAGTELETMLERQGRLQGDPLHPDYSFTDRRLDLWFSYLSDIFSRWVVGEGSLQSQLRWSLTEVDVLERFYPSVAGLSGYRSRIQFLAGWYNEIFFRIVEQSAESFRRGWEGDLVNLESIQRASEQQRGWLLEHVSSQRDCFLFDLQPLDGSSW